MLGFSTRIHTRLHSFVGQLWLCVAANERPNAKTIYTRMKKIIGTKASENTANLALGFSVQIKWTPGPPLTHFPGRAKGRGGPKRSLYLNRLNLPHCDSAKTRIFFSILVQRSDVTEKAFVACAQRFCVGDFRFYSVDCLSICQNRCAHSKVSPFLQSCIQAGKVPIL